MKRKILLGTTILLLFSVYCFAQQNDNRTKIINAIKTIKAPKIDGLLTEEVWLNAPIANNFIISQPNFGFPSAQKTEVKIVYDNDAIYIAAYLYDTVNLIRKQLTARDVEERQDVDFFAVTFDTYNDKQNAFQFGVTSVNVQSDARLSGGGGNNGRTDRNWDAVWDSKTSITNDGWVVEMKIPYMSLRFPINAIQDWGINFYRNIRRTNEASYWNSVNPNTSGFVNQSGLLKGLKDLKPPLRLAILPYITSGYSTVPTNNGTINNTIANGGMDVKWGINESFTMDMTLIPDFGQVISDNVVLNLSPFEQQFTENRPFFTEGTELFNKAGIFYSRRIGKTPNGYFAANALARDSGYKIIKNSTTTQLYNATKFSGRTKNNLGIGIFNAITAPMFAEFENTKGEKIKYETEPMANYNIIVLDQALKNRSSITLTNTNVIRNGNARDANVTALDISLFDKKNMYSTQLHGRYSSSSGANGSNGFNSFLSFGKISGTWQWGVSNNIESKNYNPNDLGILFAPNEFQTNFFVSYNQFTPSKRYNYRRYSFSLTQTNLYVPFVFQEIRHNVSLLHVFKNFWDLRVSISGQAAWGYDYFDLRTEGRKLKKAPFQFIGLFGSSDSRKKLFIRYGAGFAESPIPRDPYYLVSFVARYRFNPKFTFEVDTRAEDDLANFGYAYRDANGESIIGRRRVKNFNLLINTQYNFVARMNLSIRARHFWSNVYYTNFYKVNNDGEWRNSEIPFTSGRDGNFNAFNIDAFYTWDFKPGCRLIAAWKNALGPNVAINGLQHSKYLQNLGETLRSPHSNEVSIRFIYFIDYNTLKRKKN